MKLKICLILSLLISQAAISQLSITEVDSTYLIRPLVTFTNQTEIPFYAIPRPRLEKYVTAFELLPQYELRVHEQDEEIKKLKYAKQFYKDAFFYTVVGVGAILIYEGVK